MAFRKKPKTINPDEIDPSVYYYDEVYDDLKDEKNHDVTGESSLGIRKDKKPSKYIDGLKETAERRKTENELRKFKKYTRDREEAKAIGDDTEVFITPSYEKKLADMRKLEDEKRRRLELETNHSLNFIKHSNLSKSIDVKGDKVPDDSSYEPQISKREDRSPQKTGRDKSDTSTKKPRKLITIEDRRNYLRELLVKRTVGPVYDDAVRRYMERKASTSR